MTSYRAFRDRSEAGRQLAARLRPLAADRPVVIGLPRGGVPVAYEVAAGLNAPLDVLLVRKIGAPGHAEFGIGAVAEGGVHVLNAQAVEELGLSAQDVAGATARAEAELEERSRRYRTHRAPLDVAGRVVVLVDDGLATGGTARAALRALRARGPRRLVLAVPVGVARTVNRLAGECDEVVCLLTPEPFWAVGEWYLDFGQTTDAEVEALLDARRSSGDVTSDPDREERAEVHIATSAGPVAADLVVPPRANGLVIFAHGSGSSRHSPRNRQVAEALNAAGLATLLVDLLTTDEERDRSNVFDIPLLGERLIAATAWARRDARTERLGVGYFGASTGAGAALWAAADLGDEVRAVVSRGGRPDLAAARLADVRSPTLLIVGGLDEAVLELNRMALARLRCPATIEVVPGASHLFEEPGTLERVSELAAGWFARHLPPPAV